MSFLFPLAGWLGLLGLPVIVFYLLKTRQRRQPVSTLLFWNALAPKVEQSPFWRRLRRWVSLALQLLILALMVLALARPAFEWERTAPRRLVAVLDPSVSMTAGRHQQEAREALLQMIGRLRPQDEMALLEAGASPRILHGWTSGRRSLRDALKEAQQLPVGSDPRPALELARELARLREQAEIVFFSDAVWPETMEKLEGVSLIGRQVSEPINAGITLFAVRRSPVAPGQWQLDVEVSAPHGFEGELELQRDGVPHDLVTLSVEPGGLWQKSWRGDSEAQARFSGLLRVGPGDQLAADNEASALLPALRRLNVLLIGSADPFLEAVLASVAKVAVSRLDALPEPLPPGVDLVMIRGGAPPVAPLPAPTALLLIDPRESGFWGERVGTLEHAPVTEEPGSSRLWQHVRFDAVAIRAAGVWKPAPGSESLASSLEHPLIFGQWDRSPRWMVLGFDLEASDLPLRAAFPVLIGNLLESLRPEDSTGSAALLPGRSESGLKPHPVEQSTEPSLQGGGGWAFPGWWWLLLAAVVLLVLEWGSFHRRVTD